MLRQSLMFLTACICVLWPEAAVGVAAAVWIVRCCTE